MHAFPGSSSDVEDEPTVGLVIFAPPRTHTRSTDSLAVREASEYVRQRGAQARRCQNMLLFLAPDANRLPDLLQAVRTHKAWASIEADRDRLNLDQHGLKLAQTQVGVHADTVRRRIAETFIWLLAPRQEPRGPVTIDAVKVDGRGSLAERATRRAQSDELVITAFGASLLRMELDRVPLWRGDHVQVRQAWEDFARYAYLPRLRDQQVFLNALSDGPQQINLAYDGFGYADGWDEQHHRYRGLILRTAVEHPPLDGLIVKADVAERQADEETATAREEKAHGAEEEGGEAADGAVKTPARVTRFYARTSLDATRMARDAGNLATEVVSHLVALGLPVNVTLEIEAQDPDGLDERTARVLSENARALEVEHHEFD